ncbi:hypothetical protein [Cohnella yongneupensis]|uniref:Membrane protein NfeD2 N-terminal transmembrane domain-containing protein n=1 Tax=Cohnella yongneupensis TaxID=425006 RepID=A0ABW0QX95_9BACL
METLMMALFLIGVGYAVLTTIVGDLFGMEAHAGGLPFLSPTVIATFVTVFGGIGYLLLHNTDLTAVPVAGLALLAALGVSSAILFLVVIPLHAAQKGVALSAKTMIGREAKVVTSIEVRRVGEIVYEQGGSRHSAPAKANGNIEQGAEVRIVGELAGTFVVEKI